MSEATITIVLSQCTTGAHINLKFRVGPAAESPTQHGVWMHNGSCNWIMFVLFIAWKQTPKRKISGEEHNYSSPSYKPVPNQEF